MRFVAVPLLVLLVACVPRAPVPERLTQSEWRFVSIDGDAPVVPDRATLTFRDDRLSANVGCNTIAGDWRVEQERLIAGPLAGTRMFCEGAVWEQEQAISALLVAAPTIEWRDGALVLQSSGHEAHLEPAEPQP
ncbi:META domain-containing protein [Pelagerythrobacter marensis]|uniref:META domain-containing protein n=1 Tax=Pelagerythrobacter marensis TaxID=543877 RepID=A0ABZ2D062_9SPHN